MHSLYEHWLWLFDWLTKQGAARATVIQVFITSILVFITAWYVILTRRMAMAMNRQTRAMIQPVLSIDFDIEKDEFFPKGRFEVKNLGAQPLLLLDMRLKCRRENMVMFDDGYMIYERHILPPGGQIASKFDFTERFKQMGVTWWSPGIATFNLEVVASDLSEEIVLTYRSYAHVKDLRVTKGTPLRVHWKSSQLPSNGGTTGFCTSSNRLL